MAGRRQATRSDDDNSLEEFLRKETTLGNMESRCEEFLIGRIFRRQIHLDSGEYLDEISIYQPVGSFIIQKIIDDHEDLGTIHLRRPAPNVLPIVISKISDDSNSFIIPSEELNIDAILSRSPDYQLEAVICEINQREIIFMKNLSTNEWFYYQKQYTCEQFSKDLNEKLNQILQSRSTKEQRRLIQSAHFLISMIFYNAIKYIYKKEMMIKYLFVCFFCDK